MAYLPAPTDPPKPPSPSSKIGKLVPGTVYRVASSGYGNLTGGRSSLCYGTFLRIESKWTEVRGRRSWDPVEKQWRAEHEAIFRVEGRFDQYGPKVGSEERRTSGQFLPEPFDVAAHLEWKEKADRKATNDRLVVTAQGRRAAKFIADVTAASGVENLPSSLRFARTGYGSGPELKPADEIIARLCPARKDEGSHNVEERTVRDLLVWLLDQGLINEEKLG